MVPSILDRIMRHINGVYTQRHNRRKRTDEPLFRGRYKAILVDEEAYFLKVGRYIHRNPAEVKGAGDEALGLHRWSSYPVWDYRNYRDSTSTVSPPVVAGLGRRRVDCAGFARV